MQKFFNTERMLSLAEFKYYKYTGISAELHVCANCLPVVVTHGFSFQEQCGDDDTLTGQVFVRNILNSDHEFEPCQQTARCANCNRIRQKCWILHISLSNLEFISDRDRASKQTEWGNDIQVEMLDKRGQIVQQTGYSLLRPWIAIYTIKFEDGQRIDAKRWQFQIVKTNHE